ncbi:hypothetical protein SSX86_020232 [Deinandra increscens subsp. villosa]|uniref:Uncharacterized protein n=1 Tax=Deinandra increscens subsp. villosa TaxID=3103831 RepID=A0AAP0CUE4_9ASTR
MVAIFFVYAIGCFVCFSKDLEKSNQQWVYRNLRRTHSNIIHSSATARLRQLHLRLRQMLPVPVLGRFHKRRAMFSRSFDVYFPRNSAQVQPPPPDVTKLYIWSSSYESVTDGAIGAEMVVVDEHGGRDG